jgi:hypothetical protein
MSHQLPLGKQNCTAICFIIYNLFTMHKTKLAVVKASSGTYQVEWCQWVKGVQLTEWRAAA